MDRIRSYWSGPLTAKSPELARLFNYGGPTSTGVNVSEYSALNFAAVYAAVRLISGDVGSLPLVLYRKNGNRRERYESHPLYRILHDAPNPESSSLVFRQTLQAHALTWGNGYAEIERDDAKRPRYLWPLTPDRVHPFRDQSGRLLYRVTNPSAKDSTFDAADILHIPGLGFDGVSGYSVITMARESVALGMAAERFGGKFFGNGSTFGGVLSHPTKFSSDKARENFQSALRSQSQGVDRAHNFLLVEEGINYARLGIPPNEAQFLESRAFQVTEIARWFGVPPHKIGDLARATFSNIEQQNIEYFQATLVHWLETWEQELMRKLISPLERNQQYIEHVTEALLRGDSAGRAALEAAEFQIGGLMPNEARALSNRDPVDGGDRVFVPMNMMPIDRIDEYINAQIEHLKPVAPKETPPAIDPMRDAYIGQLRDDLESAKLQIEAAKADESHARELLDGARNTINEISATHASELEKRDEVIASLSADHETLTELVATVSTERDQARSDCQLAKTAHDDTAALWTSDRAELQRQIEQATASFTAEQARREDDHQLLSAALLAVTQERDQVVAERESAKALAEERLEAMTALAGLSTSREAERDAARSAADDMLKQREEDRTTNEAAILSVTHERDAALVAAASEKRAHDESVSELVIAERERESAALMREKETARAEQAERDKGIAEQAQQAANTTLDQMRAEWDAARQAHAERLAGIAIAHRGLVVDVMRRMTEREIDRAKRHQTTPQKFRAWVETFYQTHVDALTDALVPAVRAHLSLLSPSNDPHALARQLASDHCAESERQLMALLYVDDFAPMLERTLQQWETSRPEAVADRLLKRGVDHVRHV